MLIKMVKCIVPGCPISDSTSDKNKNKLQKALEQNVKISLHRLPRDINRRKLWLNNFGLDAYILRKNASICSLHFKEENINRTLGKIYLHENAVPYADAFVDSTHSTQENIENQENNLISSFTSVDYNSDHKFSYLETFSSIDTHCKNQILLGIQNDHNYHKIIFMTDEQMFLDECTGKLIKKTELLPTDQIQQDCTIVLDKKKFTDRCTSPINLPENFKVHRSTSVSPQHFQNDKDDIIKYLKASLEEYKQKSQQTIEYLKCKIKQQNLKRV